MGLLQKLLGRRPDDDDDAAGPSPDAPDGADGAATEGTAKTPAPRNPDEPTNDTSSVLGDAAPLPDGSAAVDGTRDESSEGSNDSTATAPPADARSALPLTQRITAPLHEWPGYPRDDEPDAEESDRGGDTTVSGTVPAAEADGSTAAVEPEPDPEPEPAVDADAAKTSEQRPPETEYFVPERPRRELLDMERPTPPVEETKQSTTALPLDVAGSPRAALRAAGVAVPHMQQIVQRGPVRLWAFGVRASEALGWWLQIRQVHEQTGWLPVLLGSADDWLDNGEGVLHEGEDEISRLAEVDVKQLLADKAAEAGEPPRGVPILPTRGDSDFAVPKTDGLLGLVEAEHGWQIPALLPWKGSSNWELYGAEHAGVLRHWHELHEVELVSMTWDILELYVPNPPTADEEVLRVAEEVYAYCPDLMAAGVPTLDDLAVHMIRSRAWYFRWT